MAWPITINTAPYFGDIEVTAREAQESSFAMRSFIYARFVGNAVEVGRDVYMPASIRHHIDDARRPAAAMKPMRRATYFESCRALVVETASVDGDVRYRQPGLFYGRQRCRKQVSSHDMMLSKCRQVTGHQKIAYFHHLVERVIGFRARLLKRVSTSIINYFTLIRRNTIADFRAASYLSAACRCRF